MSGDALVLESVTRTFGALRAIENVSLSVAAGERRAVIGANGAGKTTLFNVITGDYAASAGRVRFFGDDITEHPPRVRRIVAGDDVEERRLAGAVRADHRPALAGGDRQRDVVDRRQRAEAPGDALEDEGVAGSERRCGGRAQVGDGGHVMRFATALATRFGLRAGVERRR